MSALLTDAEDLVALGAFAGAQVLVVVFSVIKANAYRDRALLYHAAATMAAVLTVQALAAKRLAAPESALLIVMALASLQLRDLASGAGALLQARHWMLVVSGTVCAVAVAAAFQEWALVPGVALWCCGAGVLLHRLWRQARPWVWWLLLGQAALACAGFVLASMTLRDRPPAVLPIAALLTLWTASVYLATGWRGRIAGETRARMHARNTVDPLTGLSTPIVLSERVNAARTMMQRYGHPSALLLVQIEHLHRLATEYGPEAGEAAVLAGAIRLRQCLREGDVAARISHSRMAVLAEGLSTAEAAANVASRILVAGLREPLAGHPAEFLHFRIVMAAVPDKDVPAKTLLQRMGSRLDQELHAPTERRIVALPLDDLLV